VQPKVDRGQPRPVPHPGPQCELASAPEPNSITFMSWMDFVSLLRRRAGRIQSTVVVGIGLALAYLFIATPQYWATALLIVDTRGKRILSVEAVLPSLPSEIATIESQVQILRSRRIPQRVLVEGASPSNHISNASDGHAAEKPAIDEYALRDLMKQLKIERRGLSYVIDVSARDPEPKKAAQIANAMVDAYVADQLETKIMATRDASNWLMGRVAEMSIQVRSAEERVANYRAQYGLVDAGDGLLSKREITDHATQLTIARSKIVATKARLKKVEKLAATLDGPIAIGKAFESTLIAHLLQQQSEIQRNLGKMISRFGEQHPSAVDARAELDTLKRDIAREIDRLLKAATNDFETAQMHFVDQKQQYADRSLIAIGLSQLERDAETTRQLYVSLLKRLKETEAQESLQTPDARVVAYAAPPLYPSSPKKALTLAFAVVGSLMMGILIALLEDRYASIKRERDDIKGRDDSTTGYRYPFATTPKDQ